MENCKLTFSSADKFDDRHDSAIHDAGALDSALAKMGDQPVALIDLLPNRLIKKLSSEQLGKVMRALSEVYSLEEQERKNRAENVGINLRALCDCDSSSKTLRQSSRIACLCENGSSDYMWENYAGAGTGYMLRYNTADLRKMGSEYRQAPVILPVVYLDDLPDTYALPFLMVLSEGLSEVTGKGVCQGAMAALEIRRLYCKLRNPYQREEERRIMIAPLEHEAASEYITRGVRPGCVVPGPCMSPEDKKRLMACAEKNGIRVCD